MVRVVVGMLVGAVLFTTAEAVPLDGRRLFLRKCGFCHQFRDIGKAQIGPDLTGLVELMDARQLATFIRSPRAVNPESRMPGQRGLNDHQVSAIVQFLTTPQLMPASADEP